MQRLKSERPIAASVLGFVGGMIILVSGVIVGATFLIVGTLTQPGPLMLLGGLFSIVIGVPIIVGAVMLYVNPENHIAWSIVVVSCSLASWVTPSYGGFYIGLILGLAGGILGITWTPPAPLMSLITKTCQNCGKIMEGEAKYCSNCGNELP